AHFKWLLRIAKLETLPAGAHESTSFISREQPFEVRLTLDMSHMVEAELRQFDYYVSVYAKSLNTRQRHLVGEMHGALTLAARSTLTLPGATLPPGIYRLEAAVTLAPMPAQPDRKTSFGAMLEGGLLRIH